MILRTTKDSIYQSEAELLVCPVDCQGAAARTPGWGIARRLSKVYPSVFAAYAERCERGELEPGAVHAFQHGAREAGPRDGDGWGKARVIALVAVKNHVRDRVDAAHVEAILTRLREIVVGERISSVALPALGYDPVAGAWPGTWEEVWPALQASIRKQLHGLSDVLIEVHEPRDPGGWPVGCPSANQLRTGRIMAGLGLRELAAASGLVAGSIVNIENRHTLRPRKRTLVALRTALEGHGVEFGAHGWVRHVDDTEWSGMGDEQESQGLALASACRRAMSQLDRARNTLARVCKGTTPTGTAREGAKP